MSEPRPHRPPLPPQADMSPEAIMQRLRLVGELNELCWFLGQSELARKAAEQSGVPWQSSKPNVPMGLEEPPSAERDRFNT